MIFNTDRAVNGLLHAALITTELINASVIKISTLGRRTLLGRYSNVQLALFSPRTKYGRRMGAVVSFTRKTVRARDTRWGGAVYRGHGRRRLGKR